MGQSTTGEMSERELAIRDIERTRNEMGEIVNALEERLSPAHLKEQMADLKDSALEQVQDVKERLKADVRQEVETVKNEVRAATIGRVEHMVERASDNVRYAGTTVAGSVRDNPIPYAMIGLGVGWLIASSRRRASEDGYARIGGRTEQLDLPLSEAQKASSDEESGVGGRTFGSGPSYGDTYEDRARSYESGRVFDEEGDFEERRGSADEDDRSVVERGRERLGEAYERAHSGAAGLSREARTRADRARTRARRGAAHAREAGMARVREGEERIASFARDNPLALGAIVFAIGAAFGLALPRTGLEARVVGRSRQRVVGRLETAAKGALESIQEKAHTMHHHEGREDLRPEGAGGGQVEPGGDRVDYVGPDYAGPSRPIG